MELNVKAAIDKDVGKIISRHVHR